MSEEVSIYFARSKTSKGVAPGFVLVFDTEIGAVEGFDLATESVREGRLPPVYITLTPSGGGLWSFELVTMGTNSSLVVDADAIPSAAVTEFQAQFKLVQYYFVIFGFRTSGGLGLLPPQDNALYKRELTVNGELVQGGTTVRLDWNNIFGEGTSLEIGTLDE